ncbi:MAG: polysaccharide deacetylase family protein, partial [Salinivenus sp.]
LQAVLAGDAALPERAVAVTFDDGLLNNWTVALPILKRLEVPAFFFLPTGFLDAASEGTLRRHWSEDLLARFSYRSTEDPIDPETIGACLPALDSASLPSSPAQTLLRAVEHLKGIPPTRRADRLEALRSVLGHAPSEAFPADPDGTSLLATMTWDQARRAATDGITLGGHTVNHEGLAALPNETAAVEIEQSLNAIDEHTPSSAVFFSYPYGRPQDFSSFHQSVLADLGCRGAFTQIAGFNDRSTDPLSLRRMGVSSNHTLDMFAYVVSGTKTSVDRIIRGRRPSSP